MNRSPESNRWLLPEGVEEILPPAAAALEQCSRNIIDQFTRWGYQLVIPPLIEYLDSLLTGTGEDLELQTFKITDLLSGRMMGIRADTTPQVARIDAHNLKQETPTRLCYVGTVLHTRPVCSGGTRSPLQVGAELYGHDGIESDVEILCLMLETLNLVGVTDLHIDLGHVGVFRGLVRQAGLDENRQGRLFGILQRKAVPELRQFLNELSLPDPLAQALLRLPDLHGSEETLEQARELMRDLGDEVNMAIDQLTALTQRVRQRLPDAPLFYDLAELRGYHYHSGVMFAAYVPGHGDGIAFGGRYDDVGESFGRARPATGFSTDLKTLMSLTDSNAIQRTGIFAPCTDDQDLMRMIDELRTQNEIVIMQLPGQTGGARELVRKDNRWVVESLD